MKKAILFGTGHGSYVVSQLLDYEILFYVDNNQAAWGSLHLGKPVRNPNELLHLKENDVTIVIASSYYSEMKEQLLRMGYLENKDFIDGFSLANRLLTDIQIEMNHQIILALNKGSFARSMRQLDNTLPSSWEYSAFSQNGEDGIVEVLIEHLKESNRYTIEIGASDGIENNTAFLAIVKKYNGLMIEGNNRASKLSSLLYAKLNLGITCIATFVSLVNLNDVKEEALYLDPDLMSIDIDGNDYYIVKGLFDLGFRPKIFVVEYNSAFGPTERMTIRYLADFQIHEAHDTRLYYGVSISAWKQLFEQYGYRFITVEQNGVNAFFVNPAYFDQRFLNAIKGTHFRENFYQLTRFKAGWEEQYQLVSNMPYNWI